MGALDVNTSVEKGVANKKFINMDDSSHHPISNEFSKQFEVTFTVVKQTE